MSYEKEEILYVKIKTEEYRNLIQEATAAQVRLEVENRNTWKIENERNNYRMLSEQMREFIDGDPEIAAKYNKYLKGAETE